MNFADIFEARHHYTFPLNARFVSVRSIEYEYNRSLGIGESPRNSSLFAAWLDDERKMRYPTLCAVYNYIMINPKKLIMTNKERQERLQFLTDTDIKVKINSLIHSNSTIGALFVHPMLAITFSLQLSISFAVDIIGHIQGIMMGETNTRNVNINLYRDIKRELHDRNNLIADFQRTSSECDKEITQLREQIIEKNREIRQLQHRNDELAYELNIRTRTSFFTRISLAGARIFSC